MAPPGCAWPTVRQRSSSEEFLGFSYSRHWPVATTCALDTVRVSDSEALVTIQHDFDGTLTHDYCARLQQRALRASSTSVRRFPIGKVAASVLGRFVFRLQPGNQRGVGNPNLVCVLKRSIRHAPEFLAFVNKWPRHGPAKKEAPSKQQGDPGNHCELQHLRRPSPNTGEDIFEVFASVATT